MLTHMDLGAYLFGHLALTSQMTDLWEFEAEGTDPEEYRVFVKQVEEILDLVRRDKEYQAKELYPEVVIRRVRRGRYQGGLHIYNLDVADAIFHLRDVACQAPPLTIS